MPCGCKCRPTRQTFPAPCTDCGPYGSTCCLKMTGEDETWYFRATIYEDNPPSDRPSCGTADEIGILNGLRWVDGDPCEVIPYPTYGQQSNLCGGLTTASPCRTNGDLTGVTPTSRQRAATITWIVADDCSEVAFTLYHYDTDGVLTRYYGTAPTNWLTSGTPVTVGPFEVIPCPSGEPAAKQYNICCWQATAVTPDGSFESISGSEVITPICDHDPRWQCVATEQCSGGTIGHSWNQASDPESVIGTSTFQYEVSLDYTTVEIDFRAVLSIDDIDPGGYRWTSDGSGSGGPMHITVPYTADWFLTPIVIEATGATSGLDPADATITLSVCGYDVGGDPCWGDKLVCADLAYEASSSLDGTFAMPWDGEQYVSEWQTYSAFFEVRIRLRESDTTPGTWSTILDVIDLTTNTTTSTVIGSEEITCDTEGTPSGGGVGTVVTEDLTITIAECIDPCPPCLPGPLYVTLSGASVTGGTYELLWSYNEVQGCMWLMEDLSPITGTGTGYQVQVFLRTYESVYGIPWAGEPCAGGGEMWVLYCYIIDESTGFAVADPAPLNVCIVCDAAGTIGYVTRDVTIESDTFTIEVFD